MPFYTRLWKEKDGKKIDSNVVDMKNVDNDIYSSIEGKTLSSDEFGQYLVDKHYYKQMESWTTAIIDFATDNVHSHSLD